MTNIAADRLGVWKGRLDPALTTVVAASLFNFLLCLLFTQGAPVGSPSTVACCEIVITGYAFWLCRSQLGETGYVIILALVLYLLGLWSIRLGSTPKIVRDLVLPI